MNHFETGLLNMYPQASIDKLRESVESATDPSTRMWKTMSGTSASGRASVAAAIWTTIIPAICATSVNGGWSKRMRDFLCDVWRFIRRRDSESACCLMIVLSRWLSARDVRQMRDYMQALWEAEQQT